MKLITALATYLLLPNVEARPNDGESKRTLQNDFPETASNDMMGMFDLVDTLTFTAMSVTENDCEGVRDGWGANTANDDLPSTIVEFDYDIFIEKGSNLNAVLGGLQNKLLRRIGRDVFPSCSRRLTAGDLNGSIIDEINTSPSDTVSGFASCKIEDADIELECHPMLGFVTAYYSSLGNETVPSGEGVRRLDESSVRELVLESVERAMGDSDQVFYLGDRETYNFGFEDSYLVEEVVIEEEEKEELVKDWEPEEELGNDFEESYLPSNARSEEESTEGTSVPVWPIVGGCLAGLVGIVGVATLYKKKKPMKDENGPVLVEAADIELLEEGEVSRGLDAEREASDIESNHDGDEPAPVESSPTDLQQEEDEEEPQEASYISHYTEDVPYESCGSSVAGSVSRSVAGSVVSVARSVAGSVKSAAASVAGSVGGPVAGSDVGSVCGSVAASVPGSVAESVPGSVAESVPGSVTASVPGFDAGSVCGSVAASVPGSVAESVPGSVTASVLGFDAGSVCGSVAESVPGSVVDAVVAEDSDEEEQGDLEVGSVTASVPGSVVDTAGAEDSDEEEQECPEVV